MSSTSQQAASLQKMTIDTLPPSSTPPPPPPRGSNSRWFRAREVFDRWAGGSLASRRRRGFERPTPTIRRLRGGWARRFETRWSGVSRRFRRVDGAEARAHTRSARTRVPDPRVARDARTPARMTAETSGIPPDASAGARVDATARAPSPPAAPSSVRRGDGPRPRRARRSRAAARPLSLAPHDDVLDFDDALASFASSDAFRAFDADDFDADARDGTSRRARRGGLAAAPFLRPDDPDASCLRPDQRRRTPPRRRPVPVPVPVPGGVPGASLVDGLLGDGTLFHPRGRDPRPRARAPSPPPSTPPRATARRPAPSAPI